MNDFDPKNCPVGISNEKQIENVEDKFSMAIQRLEEKLDDMKNNMDKGFSEMNEKLTKLENRLDDMNEKLPEMIDERIESKKKDNAWSAFKWVVVTIGGSLLLTAIGHWIWG